ncbi:MAG: hypothetical protein AB9866_26155 [Syntrophobacteraceae bacterium]
MEKNRSNGNDLAIRTLIKMPSGPVPLEGQLERAFLPLDNTAGMPQVTYGRYLRSVAAYLSAYSFRAIREVLARNPEPAPPLRKASTIALVSEKHGALYSVCRLTIRFPGAAYSFAVNTAFLPQQQAFLQLEYRLLRDLYRKFRLPYLPRPLLSGRTTLQGHSGAPPVRLFIAEWFEKHHEFHLTEEKTQTGLRVGVWNYRPEPCYLSSLQTEQLYENASRILTACVDTETFRQIYPWHHAAGDFVVDETRAPVAVRLITTRDYRCLLRKKSDADDKMLGSLHFFVNLSIRMRIDRLDGTGELAWADSAECLPGVIRGFLLAWEGKTLENPELPEAGDIFALFLHFSHEERLAFAEVAAGDGQIESGEGSFLAQHLPGHIRELSAALEKAL